MHLLDFFTGLGVGLIAAPYVLGWFGCLACALTLSFLTVTHERQNAGLIGIVPVSILFLFLWWYSGIDPLSYTYYNPLKAIEFIGLYVIIAICWQVFMVIRHERRLNETRTRALNRFIANQIKKLKSRNALDATSTVMLERLNAGKVPTQLVDEWQNSPEYYSTRPPAESEYKWIIIRWGVYWPASMINYGLVNFFPDFGHLFYKPLRSFFVVIIDSVRGNVDSRIERN